MPFVDTIFEKIRSVIPMKASLHEPYFGGKEWSYVKECIDTGWVSSVGKYVDKFEKDIADFTQAKFAIATTNGTSALHISYLLAGLKANEEVLVPTLTFVATINAISYCGAVPHFIDSEESTMGIDPSVLDNYLKNITKIENDICINKETGRTIRVLCVMHTLGHPVDLDPILEVCKKYNIHLIEDAAEALGSYYKGAHVGHKGLVGVLSFNGNKIITTGGGGAILTNNDELAKRAKHLTTTAKMPHSWLFDHDQIGYNYRLPNLNAALGCGQLEQLPKFLLSKRKLAEKYHSTFLDCPGVRCVVEPQSSRSNYWINALIFSQENANYTDQVLEKLNKSGIMSRPLWKLQHTLPMFKNCPRMSLPIAESLEKRVIKIPSSAILGNEL